MKTKILSATLIPAALALMGFAVVPAITKPAAPSARADAAVPHDSITGDYVEARTASVFAGACHYNGELVTIGHDAVLAWNVTAGSWHGTNLANIRAAAAVSSPQNLKFDDPQRKSELVIDTAATDAQARAFVDFVRTTAGKQLGTITSVRRGPVTFSDTGSEYRVQVPGFAALTVQPMPDHACCLQPNLVWYSPLVHLENRKVGYTEQASYSAGTISDAWQRAGENSAFYGKFTF